MPVKFEIGQYLKYTDIEDGEKFSIVGQVVGVNPTKEQVTLHGLPPYTNVTLPMNSGEWQATSKPKALTAVDVSKLQAQKERKTVHFKPGTKQYDVYVLVRDNSDLSRKDLIDKVVQKFGMTPAGAATYIYNAQKVIKNGT